MKYAAVVIQDGDDGSYSITFPDLPGCTSAALCLDEAAHNAQEAVCLWLEDAAGCSEPRPMPSTTITAREGETILWIQAPEPHLKAA